MSRWVRGRRRWHPFCVICGTQFETDDYREDHCSDCAPFSRSCSCEW